MSLLANNSGTTLKKILFIRKNEIVIKKGSLKEIGIGVKNGRCYYLGEVRKDLGFNAQLDIVR